MADAFRPKARKRRQPLIAGAEAAKAMAPEAAAIWKQVYDQVVAIPETIRALCGETRRHRQPAQTHALRAKRKEITISRASIRAEAANECPRPVLGPNAPGPQSLRDSIWLATTLAIEALQKGVIHENALDARRNNLLVSVNPRQVAGRTVVDAKHPLGDAPSLTGHNLEKGAA